MGRKVEPRTFNLVNDAVKENLRAYLAAQPLEPVLQVTVKVYKVDRSTAQNRLYWVFVNCLAGEQGLTKEEVHADLKRRLLVPIYERDNAEFAEAVQSVRKLHTFGLKSEAKALGREIVRLTTTTTANVEQFREYLDEIEKDSANRGIFLPRPDMYGEAMG